MRLLGKDIMLADKLCVRSLIPASMNDYHELPDTQFVNLYVNVTNRCNAHCPFCCNDKKHHTSSSAFDMDKLFLIISEIVKNGINLNRISLTGGEPGLYPDTIIDLLQRISECDECTFTQVQLNTNGLNKDSQTLMHHPRLDSVSLSLHHYDRDKLSELYGHSVDFNPLAGTKSISNKLNISCNLIKGYIDSPAEIEKMICYSANNEIKTLGFVSLMQKNRYCRERFVDFRKIDLSTIPSLIFSGNRSLSNICSCANYLCHTKNYLMEIYFRINENPMFCGSSLLYDGEYLRQGFNNDNIIF